jgi:hypothetical protein
MLKHATVLLATFLAFGASMLMMQRAIGIASPWMVLLFFFCFLSLAKVAQPIYMLRLPESVRGIRPWELEGDPYRRLAVPQFGLFLKRTPLRLLNSSVYVSRSRPDRSSICRQIESAEAIHFWAAILLMPYLVFGLWARKWGVVAGFAAVQIFGNAYPIMHLRYVRGRLDRILRSRGDGGAIRQAIVTPR